MIIQNLQQKGKHEEQQQESEPFSRNKTFDGTLGFRLFSKLHRQNLPLN